MRSIFFVESYVAELHSWRFSKRFQGALKRHGNVSYLRNEGKALFISSFPYEVSRQDDLLPIREEAAMCQYRHVAGLKHEVRARYSVRNVQLTIQLDLEFEYSSQG